MKSYIKLFLWFLGVILKYYRPVACLVFMFAGIYLASDLFRDKTYILRMESWLKNTGDAELLRLFQQTEDVKDKTALGVTFRIYERRYGSGVWCSHFKKDNLFNSQICYSEIAALALGMSDVDAREAFLTSHADSYDACIRAGLIDEANRYASILREVQLKGGRAWRVVSRNPFSVCVYDQIKNVPELWGWYIENNDWCDKYLQTFTPGEDAGLADGVRALRSNEQIYKAFAKEIDGLSNDEVRELADDDVEVDVREAIYTSVMVFVQKYGEMLAPLAKQKVPLIEAMSVIANNHDAFDLQSEDEMQKSGEELARLHDRYGILWSNAAADSGTHVIWLANRVPIEWAEQVVGAFGTAHVATFLHDNYAENGRSDDRLLSAATETIYKCQEPGWACLQKYKSNTKFKEFLTNPKIGFRAIPYILRFGEEKAFAEMGEDPRWVDECFDKDGRLKRQQVSWYEMSPVGGDLATVLKKYCQGRPCSMAEIGWAAFDTADMVAMAFTFGMSKVAATTVKAGGKTVAKSSGKMAAKRIGKQTEKKLLSSQMRRVEQKSLKTLGKGLVNAERHLHGKLGIDAAKISSRKGWKVFKRTINMFKKAGGATANGTKVTGKALGGGWRAMKGVSSETWIKAYRASKMAMWLGWAGHTVPSKGADFAISVWEDAGTAIGKMAHAFVAGPGEGLKAAVREALGGGNHDSLVLRIIQGALAILLFLMAVKMILPRRSSYGIAKCDFSPSALRKLDK